MIKSKVMKIFMAGVLAAAAITGLSSLSFGQASSAPDEAKSQPGMAGTMSTGASLTLPPGVRPKENKGADEAIRDVFRTEVNAVASGDLEKAVDQFTSPDRSRLKPSDKQVHESFTSQAKTFRSTWQDRYHESYERQDKPGRGYYSLMTGEISDPTALTNWPINPTSNMEVPKDQGVKTNILHRQYLERGRDVAVAILPAEWGLPELRVSLAHEAPDFWKIDVPKNIDGPTLETNLSDALKDLSSSSAQSPPANTDAYRYSVHRILMAIYGVPGGSAGSSGSMEKPDSSMPGESANPGSK